MAQSATSQSIPLLDQRKFRDPSVTAKGEARARVALKSLDTLWLNTGTLCNLTCANCYIESSPKNDRLEYLSAAEATRYFDEIRDRALPTQLIGFTGGEPFLNPDLIEMLDDAMTRGFEVIVLSNAMRPMLKRKAALLDLLARHHRERMTIRVSIDHYGPAVHEAERGKRSFQPTLDGLQWLAHNGFRIDVASRRLSGETEAEIRAGFARLFAQLDIAIDAHDPVHLMVFPEMNAMVDVPEITEACWGILHKSPDDVMCASSRMVVKRKGALSPVVLACTLLPYDRQFELGTTLADAEKSVPLNHPHCAKFCVLGGAACSR
jgi:MoaA/NifB/PqqE/SkfB family radical SAM enzyme